MIAWNVDRGKLKFAFEFRAAYSGVMRRFHGMANRFIFLLY